ncbi:MAG: LacI family DNA-binding transcriptional regulator [Terracidiphilus sp.]|nr:LacI family DNA-binding transcriptional regulator [Terracidiphilus sp.]
MSQHKSGHVTLTDVAQACGLSVSTVSIVLNKAPLSKNVAEKTRQQVRATAKKLGYHPDAFARSLRRRCSQTIGVLAYDLSDPYCFPVVRGIQEGLQPVNYLPMLMDAQTRRDLFDNYLQMLLEQRAEGVIVVANWVFDEANLLNDVRKNNVPVVIVSRDLTDFGVSSILVDNEEGGVMALRYLYDLGHRKIAVIRGPEELFDSEPRWAGVQRAASETGIHLDPRLVLQLPSMVDPMSGFEGGLGCTRQMLQTGHKFTAVLAFDDLTALGVVRGLNEAGLRVPEDCSVMGFDDVLPAAVATPGITTISQPLGKMGILAAEWTVKAIESLDQQQVQKPVLHYAPLKLVERMSTARLGRKRKTERNG